MVDFASVGLRWIERLLERHQLVTVTHHDHGIAYLISEVGRDLNAQLTERYGMLESFPTRQDDNPETATNADKSAKGKTGTVHSDGGEQLEPTDQL